MLSIPQHQGIGLFGTKYSPSKYHPKLRTLYGVPTLTFCQPEIIYIGGSCMWSQGVVFAVRTQKQPSMCYGPALLLETYGHYVEGSSKNAPMQPQTSSLYFGCWWINWSVMNWRSGLRWVGRSGMQEIDFILRGLSGTPKEFLARHLVT